MIVHDVELIEKGDMVCVSHQRNGNFEPLSVSAWIRAIRPGMVAYDVGAYSGLYAILAARHGAAAIAVEPNPVMVRRIKENASLNREFVAVIQAAAGDCVGVGKLESRFSTSSASHLSSKGVPVKIIPIESFDTVCAVKVDVEGHECEVLRGMQEILDRDKPLVIAEALTKGHEEQITGIMKSHGYDDPVHADGRNLIFQCESSLS